MGLARKKRQPPMDPAALRMAMVTLHLSPPELAKRFNADDATVWRWLNGRQSVPAWVERQIRVELSKLAAA